MSSGAQGRDAVTRQRGAKGEAARRIAAWLAAPKGVELSRAELDELVSAFVSEQDTGGEGSTCLVCSAREGAAHESGCELRAVLPALPIDVEHERRVDEAVAKREAERERRGIAFVRCVGCGAFAVRRACRSLPKGWLCVACQVGR